MLYEVITDNLTEILKAGGMDWNDVVKFQGFLMPQGDLAAFAGIREKYFRITSYNVCYTKLLR